MPSTQCNPKHKGRENVFAKDSIPDSETSKSYSGDAPSRCLGPLEDLSKHVSPIWWKQVFSDEVYLLTDGNVVDDPDVTCKDIDELVEISCVRQKLEPATAANTVQGSSFLPTDAFQTNIAPTSATTARDDEARISKKNSADVVRVLDLCCGQGRHMFEVAKRYPGAKVYGVDQSAYLITLAKERASKMNPELRGRCEFAIGDCRNVPHPNGMFDLIFILGNSFGYFSTAENNKRVLEECLRLLAPGGCVLINLVEGEVFKAQFSPRSWEWINKTAFVCRERQLSDDKQTVYSREVITDTNSGVLRDQFYLVRIYEHHEINNLLLSVGFDTDSVHPETDSSKDLAKSPKINDVKKTTCKSDAEQYDSRYISFSLKEQKPVPDEKGQSRPVCANSKDDEGSRDFGLLKNTMIAVGRKPLPFSSHSRKSSLDSLTLKLGKNNLAGDRGAQSPSPTFCNGPQDTQVSAFASNGIKLLTPKKENYEDQDNLEPTKAETANKRSLVISDQCEFPDVSALIVIVGDPSIPCVGKLNNTWNPEDIATQEKILGVLRMQWEQTDVHELQTLGTLNLPKRRFYALTNHMTLLSDLTTIKQLEESSVFVFNLCDEGFLNDAQKELHVPALLEVLQLPYTGAGSACLAFCYDKGLVNATVRSLGSSIATPLEFSYNASISVERDIDNLDPRHFNRMVREAGLEYPVFVKPVRGDNSLGITARSLVHNADELHEYIVHLNKQGLCDVVVQEYLAGTEYSVGVIGNQETGYTFLPLLQVDYAALDPKLVPIQGFESKWDPNSPYWTDIAHVPAQLPKTAQQALCAQCVALFERFGCRDYARFDFRSDVHGRIKLLEVNPNPGWCWDGKLAKMAAMGGLEYSQLIAMIVRAGHERSLKSSAALEQRDR